MTTQTLDLAPINISNAALWTSRVLTALITLFLGWDASMKVLRVPLAVEGTVTLGYPAAVLLPLGVIQLAALALYLIPRTAILGAIIWTGYLGGAVATHVRITDPLFSHSLFPVYLGIAIWLSLWLREPRLRALIPFRG
jgi:DoxX-like family